MKRSPARLLLAAAAAAMIAGCSLTPELVRPAAPVAPARHWAAWYRLPS